MRRVSEDTLTLSFTDVLTCVLGAAIALFLIFVAIATLAGSQGDVIGASKGYSSAKLKSIQEKINQGFATSTIKIISDNQGLIKEITESHRHKADISTLRVSADDRILHGVQFDFYTKLEKLHIEATPRTLSDLASTEVYGFVTVGGMSKCLKLNLSPRSLADNGSDVLFKIGPQVRLFIDTSFEKAAC